MIKDKKLTLLGLIAMVFGTVVGSGIYNIPQNMAYYAAPGPSLMAWGITGAGFLLLVLTFRRLADRRPDLNAGIYQYAQAGFGNYVGFNVAWGYWLGAVMGNVALAVMLCQTFGAFWPALLGGSWQMVVVASVLIWTMYFIVSAGVKEASGVNKVITAVKFVSLLLVAVALVAGFDAGIFSRDVWGRATASAQGVATQVEGTMLVTLWCFIGIEGAVVMSARARRQRDVGRASVVGFLLALGLYVLVSALSYGVMTREELAALPDPSAAYVLRAVLGEWGYYAVIGAVIVSMLGSWVAWTMVAAQTSYTSALVKILPREFSRENSHGAPSFSLLVTALLSQAFIFVVATAESVYLAAIELTGMMVLPAYLFAGLYLLRSHAGSRWLGTGTTVFCCWLIYAGGLGLMLLTSFLYVAGIYFYVRARRQYSLSPSVAVFSPKERYLAIGLCVAAVVSVGLLATGRASL